MTVFVIMSTFTVVTTVSTVTAVTTVRVTQMNNETRLTELLRKPIFDNSEVAGNYSEDDWTERYHFVCLQLATCLQN